MNQLEQYDIVIVGAGPVGLMLSTILARWGYKIKHIDNRAEPTLTGRADGIQPRSLDLLRNMGLKSAIMEHKPYRIYEVAFWDATPTSDGIVRTGTWASCPSFIDARYPFTTTLHQGLIERDFLADLDKNGVTVQRPWTITGFRSDERENPAYPVEVTVKHVDGSIQETVRAKYLFSGEGARSFVRDHLGIGIRHKDPIAYVWGVMDGVIRTDFPDIKMKCTIHSHAGSIMVIPRENNLVRLYIQIASSTDPDWSPRKTATAEEVQEAAKKIMQPYWVEWEMVDWYSVYPIGQGISDRYTLDQRVFLGGDACHTHSPKAGQGMNTAFLDAQNLAWKIHMVEQGFADRSLLETYEFERKDVAEKLLAFDNKYAKLFSQKPPSARQVQAASATHANGTNGTKGTKGTNGTNGTNGTYSPNGTHSPNGTCTPNSSGSGTCTPNGDNAFIQAFKEACEFTSGYGVAYQPSLVTWSPTHPAQSPAVNSRSKLRPGRLFINSDVTRVIDANVVHLEQEVPLNGSFRFFVFAGRPETTARALQDLESGLRRDDSFFSAYRRTDESSVSYHEKHNPHSLFYTFCVIFASPRNTIEISRDVPGVLARYRAHVYADDRAAETAAHVSAHAKMGFDPEKGGVVVVRPDGYTALVVNLVEGTATIDALNQYFASFCTKKLGQSA